MKKLMILAAMLAVTVALAVPTVAQVSGGSGNEAESEDVEMSFSVENTGDYASQCVPAMQFGNTGNFNIVPPRSSSPLQPAAGGTVGSNDLAAHAQRGPRAGGRRDPGP